MYKIIGADGKAYGPATIEQMRRWIAEGRVNPQTHVLVPDGTEWQPASEVPELRDYLAERSAALSAAGADPGVFAMPGPAPANFGEKPRQGLAITSFVLGLLGILCFGLITGLPAIICGHMAHNRARRDPSRFGGSGFAIAGFILGYLSILATILIAALVLPALVKAKGQAQGVMCQNNLKQIGLGFKLWQLDHNDLFPSNVSTNEGGLMELTETAQPQQTVVDAAPHFKLLSKELRNPRILVCPQDKGKQSAATFEQLATQNTSYQLRSYPGIETNLSNELIVCPIHGYSVLVDGSVKRGRQGR